MPLSPEALAKIRAFMAEPTPSMSTKTRKEERNEFEQRFGRKTPTADLVARIEAAERIVWIPHCYVFFVRQATCRNCRTTVRCLDSPELFLQQRQERRDDSNPYLYTPVRVIEFKRLPRRKVVKFITVPVCEACFEGETCPKEDTPSSQEGIESPTENSFKALTDTILPQQATLHSLAKIPLQSGMNTQSVFDTPPEASAGSPSETDFGSVCGEREFAPGAHAED